MCGCHTWQGCIFCARSLWFGAAETTAMKFVQRIANKFELVLLTLLVLWSSVSCLFHFWFHYNFSLGWIWVCMCCSWYESKEPFTRTESEPTFKHQMRSLKFKVLHTHTHNTHTLCLFIFWPHSAHSWLCFFRFILLFYNFQVTFWGGYNRLAFRIIFEIPIIGV